MSQPEGDHESSRLIDALRRPGSIWKSLRQYLDPSYRRSRERVEDRDSLVSFLQGRASFVAQTSLYGYLRTRAGMRYPELFENDDFVASINIAKWQLWLACLSDLTVYVGGLLRQGTGVSDRQVGDLLQGVIGEILVHTGVPPDSGSDFEESANAVRARIASCDWAAVTDDDGPFTESPQALVRWAPVIDELKRIDAPIVLNSVRFRWQEVRRQLRRGLDARAILGG